MDEMSPQEVAAKQYMEHKGYSDARPQEVDKVKGEPCWYFYYELHDGDLELEVLWDKSEGEWVCTVTSFVAH